MHKFAEKASIAALAASQQGKYLEVSKKLFEKYNKLNDKMLKKLVGEAGCDMNKFDKAIQDPALKKMITRDMKLGRQVKVRGVPALFINGKLAKQRSLQDLSRMVQRALKDS